MNRTSPDQGWFFKVGCNGRLDDIPTLAVAGPPGDERTLITFHLPLHGKCRDRNGSTPDALECRRCRGRSYDIKVMVNDGCAIWVIQRYAE